MDKKNTMLLTVIAVATLLVAVVGATFAYFSVAGTQNATTDVNASTGKIGAVNVTKNEGPYVLTLTAEDMKAAGSDVKYYVIKSTEKSEDITTGGVYSKDPKDIEIAKVNLTGADNGDTVKCQISVRADLSGTMTGHLQTGDLFITLSADGYSGFDGVSSFDFKSDGVTKVTYNGEGDDNKTGTVTFTGTGTFDLTNNANKAIKAQIWLLNSNAKPQNYLADKSLTIQLTTTVSGCETTSPKTD